MKKILLVVISALFLLSMFTGCSASMQDSTGSGGDYYANGEVAEAPAAPEYDKGGSNGAATADSATPAESAAPAEDSGMGFNYDNSVLQPDVDRKIIYEGAIESRTKNFDDDYNSILSKLKEVGGYVENSAITGTKPENWQDQGRYASMTLRVPSDKFDAFMEMLKGLGRTVSTSVNGRDVSVEYFDTETQISTLRIRETRLQELLKQAAGLEDIIEIEKELADVSYQIQMLESQLRDYDSLIDFSQVTVNLQEVNEVQSVTPSEEPLGDRISTAFYAVLNALSKFGEGLLIFLIGGSPIIIPLVIIGVVLIIVFKARKKKKAAAGNNNTPAAQ